MNFGEAYAAARVGWRHFNKPGVDFVHLVEQHRGQWLDIAQEIDKERTNSIQHKTNTTGGISLVGTSPQAKTNVATAIVQGMIEQPYKVMPRRLWDLTSN